MPRPLYLAKTFSELNRQIDVKQLQNIRQPKNLCSAASKLFLQAKEASLAGDEEKAYLFFMRYLNVAQTVKKHPRYAQNKEEFDQQFTKKSMREALEQAEKLAESLPDRYESGDSVPTEPDESAPKKPKVSDLGAPEDGPSELNQAGDSTEWKASLTCLELYDVLQKTPDKVMILDCRPKQEWDACHVDTRKFPQWLSVPEEAVSKGLTVHLIPTVLTAKGRSVWQDRQNRTYIVVVDHQSTQSSVSAVVQSLKDVVFKYDTTGLVTTEPSILEGGFQRWYHSFGPLCIGKPKTTSTSQATKRMPTALNGTESVAYPEVAEVQDADLPSLHSLTGLNQEDSVENTPVIPMKSTEPGPDGSQQTLDSQPPLPSVIGSAAFFRHESSGAPAPSVAPVQQMPQGHQPLMADPSASLQQHALYAPATTAFANPPHSFPQLPDSSQAHSNGPNTAHFPPTQMTQAPSSVFHQVPPAPQMQFGVAAAAWNGLHPQQVAPPVNHNHLQQPLVQPQAMPLLNGYAPVSQPTGNGYYDPAQPSQPTTMTHGFERAQMQQGMYQVQHTHPYPQWVQQGSQIATQQPPAAQPVPAPIQGSTDNVQNQVSVPELDIVGQQLQSGMAQNAETKDEIEETKRQLDELKQILRQRQNEEEKKRFEAERRREEERRLLQIEEDKRRQLELERQRRLADEAQRSIMEERLEVLERENTVFREQQTQLAMQTQMMLAKAEQMQSLQTAQPQEAVYPSQRLPSSTQERGPSVVDPVPKRDTVMVPVATNADTAVGIAQPASDASGGAPLKQTSHNSAGIGGIGPGQGTVPTSAATSKADQELVKKMEELEARLKLLNLREKSFQTDVEKQDQMLREREAAMREQQVQWSKQKEQQEKELQEEKAKLAEQQAAFLRQQAEVKKQQDDYRQKQEELFGMMQLMNKQQPAGAPREMQLSGGNLPQGWEKRLDQRTGRFYYIDHKSKTTHWNPPTNWLMYGQGSRPPSRVPLHPQLAQPTVGGVPGPTPSAGAPVPPSGGRAATVQPPSQPKVDRSMKPTTPPQPLTQPDVNRMLKPMSQALVQQKTRTLQGISGSWGARGLTGLRNLGNTCFLNSTLQCLFNTVPLADYFLGDGYKRDINYSNPYGQNGEMAEEFGWLAKNIWLGGYKCMSPRDLKSTIVKCNDRFEGTQQQDSQEVLALLLGGLHEDLNKAKQTRYEDDGNTEGLTHAQRAVKQWNEHLKSNNSVIVSCFQGQFRSTVRCLTCGYQSVVFEVFMYLTVPIPTRATTCTLQDCIRLFTQRERMSGDNKWKCPKCNALREVEKAIEIWKLPPILIIILKRFWWDNTQTRHKITNNVDFPVDSLDMAPHVVGPPPQRQYKLYATSNHTGRMDGGHYIAYCKSAYTGRFHCFDDEEVRDISQGSIKSPSAYFLFYTSVHFKQPRTGTLA